MLRSVLGPHLLLRRESIRSEKEHSGEFSSLGCRRVGPVDNCCQIAQELCLRSKKNDTNVFVACLETVALIFRASVKKCRIFCVVAIIGLWAHHM
jgi:hypothetical protein